VTVRVQTAIGDLRPADLQDLRRRGGGAAACAVVRRPPAQVRAQIARLRSVPRPRSSLVATTPSRVGAFIDGALLGLRWMVWAGPGPLTGRPTPAPVPAGAVAREVLAAQTRPRRGPLPARIPLTGRRSGDRDRDFARGVQEALLWVGYATASPPNPFGLLAGFPATSSRLPGPTPRRSPTPPAPAARASASPRSSTP
jgi:hypothetical protein